MNYRDELKNKKRIVVKIGSSSLIHKETGDIDFLKMEKLVRILSDLKNQDKDVVLVSSGSISVGCKALELKKRPELLPMKQACAALGQGQLMMIYQKLFLEYNHKAAQVLLTFDVITSNERRVNAENTLKQLLDLDIIPVVNENDSISTEEIEQVQTFGDNDRLSAIVAKLTGADLLVLLSDIDGMYTDDPNKNPEAEFIDIVPYVNETYMKMGKSSSSSGVGTGGMMAKLVAARIATGSGADMVITNANHVEKLLDILNGDQIGTLFLSHKDPDFDIMDCLSDD